MEKKKVIEKLFSCIEALKKITASKTGDPQFNKWYRDTEIALEYIFGKETRHIGDFQNISFTMINPSI